MTIKVAGIAPESLTGNLKQALGKASWVTESDGAAVALALRLAAALDTAFDMGELKEIPALAQRFTAILQQLHLTVETRTQGKQEEENDGREISGSYLRLLQTATSKSKP